MQVLTLNEMEQVSGAGADGCSWHGFFQSVTGNAASAAGALAVVGGAAGLGIGAVVTKTPTGAAAGGQAGGLVGGALGIVAGGVGGAAGYAATCWW